MSAGSKRNDTPAAGHGGHHARQKRARWAGKAVPAAAVVATLAAGTAAYGAAGAGHSGPGTVADALSAPVRLSNAGAAQAAPGAPGVVVAGRLAAIRPARPASPHASAGPSARPARAAAGARPVTTQAAPAPAAQPAQQATASAREAAVTTFACTASGGMLPQNAAAIVNFLIQHGYSRNAAAGIAGNIYQESKGDPESVGMGGGGLIGFTPLPAGYVTGNPAADLQRQLQAILSYNQIWASYLPALNAAATPAQAADIYVTDFERAGIPAASTREASAEAVASSCGL